MATPTEPAALSRAWNLDPDVVFLNHGSFGAAPAAVLARQSELRDRLEAEPVRFFLKDHPVLLDEARGALADFVRADPDGLVFVPNATTGVNTVLRSLTLRAGDEILSTDHGYPACRYAARDIASAAGAVAVEAEIPLTVTGPEEVASAVIARLGPRTRLVVVDHVTSPTAVVLPVEAIVAAARERGIPVLVDGAHAPGMLDLDLGALGADFYTGNCHKWLCAPKGVGFLWVAEAWRDRVRPLVLSHGAGTAPGRERFREEFDWTGTSDPTAALCVPEAIRVMAELVDGGWPEIRRRNHELACRARRVLEEVPGVAALAPDGMLGSMAAVRLPDADPKTPPARFNWDMLQASLHDNHGIEVPVMAFPAWPRRVLRVSAQLYNHEGEYRRLAGALSEALSR